MQSDSLALKYRPLDFSSLVGQRTVSLMLSQMALKEVVPHSIILTGDRGTGKTSCARILAAALNCEIKPGPCGSCTSCIETFAGTSLAVIEIDAASHGLVADIRALKDNIMYSVHGARRVVILDEAHMMSREAFNALLLMLEDPPVDTTFILVTTEVSKVPSTVLSRCMEFVFNRISVKDIVERLQFVCDSEDLAVEPALLTTVAEYADGGLRDAVMVLDQVTRVGIRSVADFNTLFGLTDYTPVLFESLLSGDVVALFSLVSDQIDKTGDPLALSADLSRLITDLLLLRAGGSVCHQDAALGVRKALAKQVESERLVAALRVLWRFRSDSCARNTRTDLDLALMMVSDALNPNRVQAPPVVQRVSLLDMQMMAAR